MTDPCAETQKGIPTGDTQASAAAESGAPLVCPYAYKNFCALACRQGPEVGAHRRQRLLRAPGRRGGGAAGSRRSKPQRHCFIEVRYRSPPTRTATTSSARTWGRRARGPATLWSGGRRTGIRTTRAFVVPSASCDRNDVRANFVVFDQAQRWRKNRKSSRCSYNSPLLCRIADEVIILLQILYSASCVWWLVLMYCEKKILPTRC